MNKIKVYFLVTIFAFTAGCSMEGRVDFKDEESFLATVQSYISSAENQDVCTNLDQLGLLNKLAEQEGKTDLLKVLNLEGIFFKALAKNLNVVAAMENIDALEKTTVEKECAYDAAGVMVCKDLEVTDNSQNVIASYLAAIFDANCMADQARFAAFIEVTANLYLKHTDVIHGAIQNESLPKVFEKFSDYASCFEAVDEYMKNTVAPALKKIDISLTLEAAGEQLEPVFSGVPECIGALSGGESIEKANAVESEQKAIANPITPQEKMMILQ